MIVDAGYMNETVYSHLMIKGWGGVGFLDNKKNMINYMLFCFALANSQTSLGSDA